MHGTDQRMSQPEAMKTNAYVAGVEKLNGHDAWALFQACAAGDMPKVKALLAKDRRLVNAQIYYYQFPIHMAIRAGYAKIVKLLLDQGAEPGYSWGLLLAARERGHRQVEEVLERAMIKRYNYSPNFDELKDAIIARDSRKIGAVLGRGPNLALASDASGNNALHWSMHCVNITRVYHGEQAEPLERLLRRHGAYTQPYHMTVRQMKQAIRDGHEVTRHPEFLGNMMGKRNAELFDLYLDSDPTAVDRMGDELACPWSAAQVRKLLDRGLDPNRPDWLGKTFLHACAASGNRSIAAVFLDAGADINARGLEFNETPLAAAVRSGLGNKESKQAQRRRRMVEFLLKRGAATNLPDDEPWATPLAWARKLGLADIEEILLKHGATG